MTNKCKYRIFCLFLFAVFMLTLPSQTLAIDIVMTFNSGSSTSPSFDSSGSKLISMMSSVESYYEDIFTATGTLNVEFYYDDLASGTLANHRNLSTSGGKPTSCRIRVNDSSYWFIDSTPFDNSEYDMDITYAGELGSPGNYYNGTVPDMLEYSHRGYSSGSEGFFHRFQQDMWSVLLHEMGHALGMTSNVASGETSDYEYDFDPDLVWGNTMAAECAATDNRYHLKAQSMMNPTNNMGYRTLPSMTDIFAIETAANWGDTTIRLERVDFYSTDANADMNDGGNWGGNLQPNYDQDVWMRDGGTATLTTGNIGTNYLRIGNDTTVSTGAYRIRSDQRMYLGDSDGYGNVVINSGGELQVDRTLYVNSGSEIQMQAGSLLDADYLQVYDGAAITGAGTIDIEDSFNLGGVLTTSGGDLVIDSDVAIDFDAADGAAVYVTGGNLSCNVALTDAMSTYVEVGAGHCLTMSQGWRLDGELYLNGGTTSSTRASIDGGLFKVAGTLEVNHQGRFFCTAEFQSAADVELTDSNDTLYLYDDTVVRAGATFTGAGRLYMTSLGELTLDDGAVVGSRVHTNGVVTVQEGSVGEATVNSAFTMSSMSAVKLFVEVDGDDSCDLLDVNAAVTLDGELIIDFIDSYTPADGDSFTVIEYTSRSGMFDTITYTGAFDLIASYGATALTLMVDYGDSATAVPEPSTLALLVGIGCCLGLFWRKRR